MNGDQKKSKGTQLINLIMDIPFFSMLDNLGLAVVAKYMNYFELVRGEILFKEGDRGDSVCFVIKGSLEVFKQASTLGKPVRLATITKNKSIGEMAVIDEYTRSATVRAYSDASIVALTKNGFDAILEENPRVGVAILKKIASNVCMNLRRTSAQLADLIKARPGPEEAVAEPPREQLK